MSAIHREFTLGTLRELIRIDSRNPSLEDGAPGEAELGRHVAALLHGLGLEVELHEIVAERANVVAMLAGAGGGPTLLINVHLDTVGAAGMEDPFSAEERDGRIFGRGAQDTKGGMAALLGATKALLDKGTRLAGDLVLAFVIDEEHASLGTDDLVRRVKADAAIVLEPSDLDICVAHRGFGVFRVRTAGRTAHGGRPDLGVDANLRMGLVLQELDRLRAAWAESRAHPLLGAASLHVPLLAGGRHLFIYAAECTADVECRTVPGQTASEVEAELRAAVGAVPPVDGLRDDVKTVLWRPAYEIESDRPIVQVVRAAAEKVRGAPPRLVSHGWWEDSAILGEAGIETVILGPTGEGLHTEEEWVSADSVVDLAEILHESILSYCGRA